MLWEAYVLNGWLVIKLDGTEVTAALVSHVRCVVPNGDRAEIWLLADAAPIYTNCPLADIVEALVSAE